MWLAPPCSSWIWLSRKTTKRCAENVEGDTTVASVAEANDMARLLADVCRSCHALRVHYVIEQPQTSLLFIHPALATALQETRAERVAVNLGQCGASSQKPLALWGTAPWLQRLAGVVRRRSMVSHPRRLTERRGAHVNGKKSDLGASAAYPRVFCCIVARLHASSIGFPLEEEDHDAAVVAQVDSD